MRAHAAVLATLIVLVLVVTLLTGCGAGYYDTSPTVVVHHYVTHVHQHIVTHVHVYRRR